MSCCCPYCMSELDINKIKYYVKVENEPSQPKLKAFLAVTVNPDVPWSTSSYLASKPIRPVFSVPTKPITLDARVQ